ncbi:FGGY-family carbohydrate kinase [Paenibacillus sp. 1P07SE]|uniref:FGGY-family carbohydrate kinase n=1 Tax=Paenibacillus sp. 1P07SE TaxID=3132209 RepID=UPI0039A738E5
MDQNIKQSIVRGETSLGIEFGSTRIKAILIDDKFETIASSSYEWENQLIDGYWTYHQQDMMNGLQETYRQLKQEVEETYGVSLGKIGSIGCSAMMQGYIALHHSGELLVPFRTWRNATTGTAAAELTERFQCKIPQRWSIAHLYQAILDNEEHVANIDYLTTLSGYIHWLLTGSKALGLGDASNISVGTSIFAMLVLEKDLSAVYPEIDIVNTPDGSPVAMVLANNCSSDINAWLGLFREFYEAMGLEPDMNQLFSVLFGKALEADADGGGLLSYGYYSGENITGLAKGRPLFVRSPESRFNLANFMRVQLFTAFAALRLGVDILTQKEDVTIDGILAHGGLFKTPLVGQKMCAAALNVPVKIMSTAGEGGAWGMAILASYMTNKELHEGLADYLTAKVFKDVEGVDVYPDSADVNGFALFMKRYTEGLAIEQAAVDHFLENWTK